jgi:3-oxoacyl-(acyl-carrier-protein) synthase III
VSAPLLGVPDTLRPSALLGLGHYRPRRVVPNSEIVDAIDSSDEWIQQRSGIIERRIAGPDETVVAMSVAAAREALDQAGVQPGQVDTVIVATVSHLLQTPSAATAIAHELGTTGAAFDISAACAGFCHGLALASDLVRAGSVRHVLVIGVERLSDITSSTDRGTAFIFSDGAGAAVVGPAEAQGIGPVVWGSDGGKYDLIRQTEDWRDVVAAGSADMPHLVMQGREVFRWAAFEMAKVATETLERSGLAPADLDVFVPHQANMRITDAMARAMKLPDTVRIARDIAHQGNASAASIPLALRQMVLDGDARSGDVALLIAFGAGLSYAAQVVRVP